MSQEDLKVASASENKSSTTSHNGDVQPEVTTQLEQLGARNRELEDRVLRTAAELDNVRKRATRSVAEAAQAGREALLQELLPSFDNLERALEHAKEGDPVAAGVRLVEQQLVGTLEKFGVSRFRAQGELFDPARHHAIEQVETTAFPPGTVAKQFAPGYLHGTRLVRPALVAVAKRPAAADASSATDPKPEGER